MTTLAQLQISRRPDNSLTGDQSSQLRAQVVELDENLETAVQNIAAVLKVIGPKAPPPTDNMPRQQKTQKPAGRKIVRNLSVETKKTRTLEKPAAETGQISYKVKGKDGTMMNLAEVKRWVDGLYDAQAGLGEK